MWRKWRVRSGNDRAMFAIGHSARDTMEISFFQQRCVDVAEAVRGRRSYRASEEMIDERQYGHFAGHPRLGAAEYKLSCKPDGKRGVYTFCMCPGGVVIAASSEEASRSQRHERVFQICCELQQRTFWSEWGPKGDGSDHPLSESSLQRSGEEIF